MKYEVLDSVLMGAEKSFKRGEAVTAKQLTDAGFDVEFLLNNKSIEGMRGTEADDEPIDVDAKGPGGRGAAPKSADPFAGRKPVAGGVAAPNAGGVPHTGKS